MTDAPVPGDNTSGGYMSRILSFATRPNLNGATTAITSSTFSTSTFNLVGHGLVTGQSVALTGTGTIDPAFTLSVSLAYPLTRTFYTEYFVIKLTNDTFQLAISHYNAMLTVPVPITFSSDITGIINVTPLGGGANWYLHEDFSRMTAKSFLYTDVDVTLNIIALVGHGFPNGCKVTLSTTGTIFGNFTVGTAYWVIWLTADTFALTESEANVYAGTKRDITSQGTGTHTITTAEHFVILTDTLNPVVNDYNTSPCGIAPKFLKLGYWNSQAGYVRMQSCLWWDNVTHSPQQWWTGVICATSDSAVFSYQFIAGDEFFFESSLVEATWDNVYIDTFTGLSSKLEPITKVGVLQSGITAGSNVVLTLAPGQKSNFTVNKYYYLYDFNGHSWVNYVKVTAVNPGAPEEITIESTSKNFPSGAVIIPYAHRYYTRGHGNDGVHMCRGGDVTIIPYVSCQSDQVRVSHQQNGACVYESLFTGPADYISRGTPDDDGYYDCIRFLVGDYGNTDYYNPTPSMNRFYGKTNNSLRTARGTMGQMTNTRTMLGIDYLYFYPAPTTYVDMITYSESAS
jgi:hypothetical protein